MNILTKSYCLAKVWFLALKSTYLWLSRPWRAKPKSKSKARSREAFRFGRRQQGHAKETCLSQSYNYYQTENKRRNRYRAWSISYHRQLQYWSYCRQHCKVIVPWRVHKIYSLHKSTRPWLKNISSPPTPYNKLETSNKTDQHPQKPKHAFCRKVRLNISPDS